MTVGDDQRDDYWGDVVYEVWRSGGDVDRIDDDRVEDNRWEGMDYDEAAGIELRVQRPINPDPMNDEWGGNGGPAW